MHGKEKQTPGFMGFLRILRLTLFAYVMVFLSSTHAIASCASGYTNQDDVFSEVRNCSAQSFGYSNSGSGQVSSSISTGDGTWQSYFPSFRIKGRAYCSKTEPSDSASAGSCDISRRPVADSIDINNDGTQCWCQATEHQQFSKVSHSWAAPFQKIYAKYVYLKDMGKNCANLCAEYCSYISSNILLDNSVNNTITSNSLRATIYDSLNECAPVENKITYISDGDIIDYQYYTAGSLILKDALKRNDYSFKGWCETENCDNPLDAGATETNWSGEKTLYAKWERNSCETGTKSSVQNGNLVCTAECADGYETNSNPFTRWSGCGANNYGNGVKNSSANGEWSAGFTYGDFIMVKGNAYCLAEQYSLPTKISVCGSSITTMPMVEDVDTTKSGNVCWCKVTGWQPFTPGRNAPFQDVEAKYIQVPLAGSSCTPQACGNVCASVGSAAGQILDGVNNYTDTELRGDIYRSVKKCELGKYTITFKDGDKTVHTVSNHTIKDIITLPTPSSKTGFAFAGWCEDLSNCDNPMIGETSGLFGDITLYAKWENNLYNAKFYHAPVVRTRGIAADSVPYDVAVVAYDKELTLPYGSPVSGYAVVEYTSDYDLETGEQKETDYLPGTTIDSYMVDGDTEFTVKLAEISTYECESGEYLPAGSVECRACPSGAICVGGVFDYDENNDQGIIEMPFGLTTVEMDAESVFSFDLSAAGTFYVDCGDGGVLSGEGVSGFVITRANPTVPAETYSCTYSTSGIKTIRFGGTATGYVVSGNSSYASISFENNPYIVSLSGDLSKIFPGAPTFLGTFKGCTNLTTIPGTLFSAYTTGPIGMFTDTFRGCSKLTEIPNDLFSNINTGSAVMFWGTFAGCTGLESLPNGMFANTTTGEHHLFQETFENCSGLKSLPENMFSGITSAFPQMFYRTFRGCTGLTGYIPPTMFSGLIANGHPNETSMMTDIFENTGLLTSCPIGMQEYITGYEGYWNYKVNGYWKTKVSCEYTDYTLNFVDGENSFGSPVTYKITDEIVLPTIDDASFMGWCVDAPNCASSAVISTGETYTGWYGDKVLYARYRATECESGKYLTDYQCVSCPEDFPSSNGGTQCYKECAVECTEHAENCNYDNNVINFVDYYNADNNHVPCNLVSVSCEQHYDYNSNDKTCVPHNYTITYMSGEDAISGLTPTSYTIESDTINLATPVKSGYRFNGWYTDSSLEGDSVAQIATGSSGNKTFYAKWTAVDYNITYELSTGGSWPIGVLHPDSYTIESSTINLATPVKTGYDFGGWYTDSLFEGNPVTQIVAGSVGDRIFYAKWTPTVYTINYELESGGYWPTGALHPETYTIESETITLASPRRVGYYRFDGWCDDEQLTQNCTEQKTILSGSTGDKTFYAKWIVGTPSSITCDNGYNENNAATAVLDASMDALTYAFYNYTGGAKIIDQNLPRIQDGRNRGQWGANFVYGNVYGVSSCNSTGGSTPPSSMKYSVSGASTMENSANGQWCWCKVTDFTPTDQTQVDTPDTPWVFVKYFWTGQYECQTTCTKTCIEKVASDQFYRAQLFGEYATCDIELYDIIYHTNDGIQDADTNWPEKYSIVSGTVTLPNNVTKEFYNFGGWCDTPELKSCSMSKTIPTGSYGEKNFYAKWVGEKRYIYFEPGTVDVEKNSPGTMPNQETFYDDVYVEINENAFVRNGYVFDGWDCFAENNQEPITLTKETTSGVTHYIIDRYEYTGNLTCKAKWQPQEYTITYNGDVSASLYPKTFTVESADISIPNPMPDSEEFEFKGWCADLEDNCDTNQLQKNYVIPSGSLGDVVLWVRWGGAVFDITYYYDEDNYPSVPLNATEIADFNLPSTYTFGTGTALPALPDQERHAFIGWYDVNDIDGDAITEISASEIGNKSFVAKWGPTQYIVTYYMDAEKNDVFKRDVYTVEDENITELPIPTKDHFEYNGWYDENDNIVTEINTANAIDREFYTTWTRIDCDDGYYLPVGSQTCQKCPSTHPNSNGATAKTSGYCYAICRAADLTYPLCNYAKPGACHYYDTDSATYLSQTGMACSSFFVSSADLQSSKLGKCNQDWWADHYFGSTRHCSIRITECQEHYHIDPHFNRQVCTGDVYAITYHIGDKTLTDEEATELGLMTSYYYRGPIDGRPTDLPGIENQSYDFLGWYDNVGFNGDAVTAIQVGDYGTKELWAKIDYSGYDIKFVPGQAGKRTTGFSGNMPIIPVDYGTEHIDLPQNDFAIDGYEFNGWNCVVKDTNEPVELQEQTVNDVKYYFINKYTYSNDVVCHAQWRANGYYLSYNCGSNSELAYGQDENVLVYYDAPYSLKSSVCKQVADLSLIGWECTNGLDSTQSTWNITDNSTCTAVWGERQYDIVYKNVDEAILAELSPKTYTVSGTPLVIPHESPTKKYALFKGWCVGDTDNCSPEQLKQNYTIPNENVGDVVLWAHWEDTVCGSGTFLPQNETLCATCPAGYYCSGGLVDIENNETDQGITGACPTGWTSAEGTSNINNCYVQCPEITNESCPENTMCGYDSHVQNGKDYYDVSNPNRKTCKIIVGCDNEKYEESGDKCLPKTFTVTYYDGETDITAQQKTPALYTYGKGFTLINAEKEHYDFVGWKNANGDDVSVITNTDYGDKVLYAQWTPKTYSVNFTANATTNIPSQSYDADNIDTVVSLPPLPQVAGRISSGWYTDPNYTDTPRSAFTPDMIGIETLYAKISYPSCGTGYETQNSALAVLDPSSDSYDGDIFVASKSLGSGNGTNQINTDKLPLIENTSAHSGLWGVYFPFGSDTGFAVYGAASCDAESGETPPDQMKYSESTEITPKNINGTNCWCQMTRYTMNNDNPVETNGTPWVYIKEYKDTTNCMKSCPMACSKAVKSYQPFRSQVFGEYSICALNEYNINYEFNGHGEWPILAQPPAKYTIVYKDVTIPALTDESNQYTFDGWCENPALTGNCSQTISIASGSTGHRTFYAKWTPKEYTITYHLNAGENEKVLNDDNPDTYTYDDIVYLKNPERPGYDFIGWYDDAVFNNETSNPAIPINSSGNKDFYANWATAVYRIKYFDNGIDIENDTYYSLGDTGGLYVLESREYYDFDGWCVDPQECDSGINNIDPTWARDINLYAKWTPKTYPVSYTCGKINIGGEEDYLPNLPNEDNSQESTTVGNVTYGEYYNLDNILPQVLQESSGKIGKCLAIPGFEFEWDCPCRNYQKPEDDDEGGISGGGGAGGGSSSSDEQLSLIWDEHGASCVGKWTAKPYNITYDLNGSVLAPATNNPNNPDVYDANTNIDLLPPTREHYTFNGWFDNQTKIEKLALQPLTWEYVYTQLLNHPDEIARYASTLGPKTLRAEWTADTYPIKYYRDGEEIDNLTPNIHTFGNETSLPASAPKAHYNFVGWYDNNEFNGNQISAISAGEYRNSGEHFTFYGKWTPENYDIYFKDLVKGQYVDVFSSQKYTYDAGTEITDKIPTKNHFEFVGWCNNPELTGNCPMTINISSTDYGNKTYYAKWRRTSCNDGYTQIGWNTDTNEPVCEANTYDIIYHFANGVNLDTYTVDTPKTLWSLTATGIGNEFSGWCENENGCEQPIKCVWCATNPDPNWVGDKDLYPQFGVAEYTIKYYDGTTLIKEDRYHYGDNVTLVAEGKAGYEFDGWYNNVALNGVPVLEIASNEYGNKVFYGKWNKIVIPTEECSGRWLHINNDKACLSSTKITNPSMAFGFDDKTYYLQMTENPDTKFNSKSNKKLRVRHGNTIYNIHDASVNSD